MEVLINRERIDLTIEQEKTVGEIVDGLATWLEEANLVIRGVSIDDESIGEGDGSGWRQRSIEGVGTLSIEANLRTTSQPKIASTIGLIEAMMPQMSEIAVSLQTGKDREAMQSIARFSDLLGELLRLYSLLPRPANNTIYDTIVRLNATLHELVKAFDASDAVLIGDVIEYEIIPVVGTLLQSLKTLLA